MESIDRHKVFISFKYSENKEYKNALINLNEKYNIFDDYSVGEQEIHDQYLTTEQIRTKIRDGWIKGASVLILLNGRNMRQSNFIDWELHAAMTDYEDSQNKKMGILVINLPEIMENSIDSSGEVKKIFEENGNRTQWIPITKDYEKKLEKRPHSPKRLIKNLTKDDVKIDIIQWNELIHLGERYLAKRIKKLVDVAFKQREYNSYDVSDKLQGR